MRQCCAGFGSQRRSFGLGGAFMTQDKRCFSCKAHRSRRLSIPRASLSRFPGLTGASRSRGCRCPQRNETIVTDTELYERAKLRRVTSDGAWSFTIMFPRLGPLAGRARSLLQLARDTLACARALLAVFFEPGCFGRRSARSGVLLRSRLPQPFPSPWTCVVSWAHLTSHIRACVVRQQGEREQSIRV